MEKTTLPPTLARQAIFINREETPRSLAPMMLPRRVVKHLQATMLREHQGSPSNYLSLLPERF